MSGIVPVAAPAAMESAAIVAVAVPDKIATGQSPTADFIRDSPVSPFIPGIS